MKCPDIRKLLSGYIDGDLDEKQNSSITEHLMMCYNCTKELDLLKDTVSLLKTKKTTEPPPDFVVQVRRKIEARRWWKEAVNIIFLPLHIKIPAEAIATVVIVCLLYYIYHEPMPMKQQEIIEEAFIYKKELESPPSREPAVGEEVVEKHEFLETEHKATKPLRSYDRKEITLQDQSQAYVYDKKSTIRLGEASVSRKSTELEGKISLGLAGKKMPFEHQANNYVTETVDETEERYITSSSQALRVSADSDITREKIELLLILKKPKKDLLRIKKYIVLLDAIVLSEGYNPEIGEISIILKIDNRNFSEFTNKLIQMGLTEPKATELSTKAETIIVRLRLK